MTYTAPIWQRGVTLMELMIVVAIVAMISAFAYPSYTEYVVNTKRTAATTTLLQISDRQQQFFMDNKSVANDLTTLGYPANPLWVADDGRTVVAAAIVEGESWRVLDAALVDRDVSWLTLPGGDPPRVLVAPDVAAASALWVRRSDGVWTRVAARDDGVTFGLRSNEGPTLLGVYGRTEQMADGTSLTVDENYIRESILEPNARVVAGYEPVMPTYQGRLKDEEIMAIIEYLKAPAGATEQE